MAAKSNLLNMALCLFGTTLICSAVLAGVYAVTKEPIDETNKAILKASIASRFRRSPHSDGRYPS